MQNYINFTAIWFIKTEMNIYNIGEVETKSWYNTVTDTNIVDPTYVTRIHHLKCPLSV